MTRSIEIAALVAALATLRDPAGRTTVRGLPADGRWPGAGWDEGRFREDLYYRINVIPIKLPPLRERKADLLLLVDHFLEKFSREHHKSIKRISTPAIDMLVSSPGARMFGAVLVGGLLFGKSLLGVLFDSLFHLTEEGWRKPHGSLFEKTLRELRNQL